MWKPVLSLLATALLLGSMQVQAGEDERPSGDRNELNDASSPPMRNRVLDLLDDEVVLATESEQTLWESERFSTSRFNKIGLRFSQGDEPGPLICRVCWQYTPDDECLDGVPYVSSFTNVVINVPPDDPLDPFIGIPTPDDNRRRSDGIPDLYLRNRYYYPLGRFADPNADFVEVRGLLAKVRCSIPVYQNIGDDPGLPGDPVPVTATLIDVKVLLRQN